MFCPLFVSYIYEIRDSLFSLYTAIIIIIICISRIRSSHLYHVLFLSIFPMVFLNIFYPLACIYSSICLSGLDTAIHSTWFCTFFLMPRSFILQIFNSSLIFFCIWSNLEYSCAVYEFHVFSFRTFCWLSLFHFHTVRTGTAITLPNLNFVSFLWLLGIELHIFYTCTAY